MTPPPTATDKVVEYEYLLPAEFDRRKAEHPVVYQPIGCMEWHGKHLPLGLDGLKAFAICKRTALAYGGIVMPTIHWGIHGPFRMLPVHQSHNLYLDENVFGSLMTEVCDQLEAVGFRVVVLLTGHYPKLQGKFLNQLAEQQTLRHHQKIKILVPDEDEVAAALGQEGDHAGTWETSLLMELYPDLVKMERLDDLVGIISKTDPRVASSRELGSRACEWYVHHIGKQIQGALADLEADR